MNQDNQKSPWRFWCGLLIIVVSGIVLAAVGFSGDPDKKKWKVISHGRVTGRTESIITERDETFRVGLVISIPGLALGLYLAVTGADGASDSMAREPVVHIVFCKSRVVLTKRHYDDWQRVRSDFNDYSSSLGPFSAVGLLEYFRSDWGDDPSQWPFTQAQIKIFMKSDRETIVA